MADRRKLQGEIERCLKKVSEGVETFEDIWQKVYNATNTNQKEKYEADLKKEIKKLQRLRDQIKTWMASSEIKDKRILLENRKLIETQMERFKVVERETKTKAYSKEGLGAAQKLDPAQKEKDEITNWLATSIEGLNIQLDQFESEIESLSITLKKKKNDKDKLDRTEELKGWLEKHRYHIKQLETLMRMLDNGTVDANQIKKIKDDVDYYIESSQDPDFEENEFIYEDLQLEDMQEFLSQARLGSDDESSLRSNSPTSTNSSSPAPSPGLINHSKSNNEETPVPPIKSVAVRAQSSGTLLSTVQNSKGALPCVSRNNSNSSESSVSSSPPLNHHSNHFVASPPPPTTPYAVAAAGNSTSSKEETFHSTHSSSSESNNNSNTNNSSCSNSTSSTNSKPSTNCIDAPSLNNGSESNSNHMDITSSSSSNMFTTAILDQISGSGFSQQLSQSQQQQQQLQNFTSSAISLNSSVHYSTTPSSCVDNVIKPPSSAGVTTSAVTCSSAASSALYSAAAATGSTAGRSCTVQPQNSPPISSCNVIGSGVAQSAINCLLMNGPVSPKVSSQIYNLPSLSGVSDEPMSSLKSMAEQAVLNAGLETHIPTSPSPSSAEREGRKIFATCAKSQIHQSSADHILDCMDLSRKDICSDAFHVLDFLRVNNSVQLHQSPEEAHIPPLLGVAPLGPLALSKECIHHIRILEAAQRHMPHPSDSERLRQYLPRNPVPTPSYYPNGLNHCDTVEFFQRLSTETLFFVFYYMEGTKAQYLAAKALKKQSWRFHTKYMMWFQRHEEPKTITDEYEQGTYIYFDYEKWGQRKKEGFTFEYRYLEDRDLN
ncbi:CCR4-NOT transcription complex subunit 3 [Trichonephila clavata]|uniref:CCR4-NOT transcription complex subunit 3 n=1 Tax=Trichonephila clavata TaxID=2740835 RepID=A0A8X6HU02_TRICU|nr:CCR4-NOT transcription complex subunit 3 [Trichonephila clavata]